MPNMLQNLQVLVHQVVSPGSAGPAATSKPALQDTMLVGSSDHLGDIVRYYRSRCAMSPPIGSREHARAVHCSSFRYL
jgi:hypothetical protein